MDKTPEHCLPSMGTQLLVGGLNFDGLSPCVELDYWGHRLVSRDRVVFTLDLFHSQQLPNGGYFSTALFRLRRLLNGTGDPILKADAEFYFKISTNPSSQLSLKPRYSAQCFQVL